MNSDSYGGMTRVKFPGRSVRFLSALRLPFALSHTLVRMADVAEYSAQR